MTKFRKIEVKEEWKKPEEEKKRKTRRTDFVSALCKNDSEKNEFTAGR